MMGRSLSSSWRLLRRKGWGAEAENDHLKLMAGLSNIFLSAPAYPASTLNDLLTQAARLSATDESRAKFSTAQKNIALNDESGNQPPPSSLLFLFLTSNRVGMTDTPSLKWASLLSLPVETILLAGVFHFGVESAAFGFLAWNLIHWALERDSALFGDSTLTFRSQAVSVLGHSLVYLVYGGFFFTIEGPGLILGLLFHLVVDSNRLTPRPVKLLESIYWTQVKRVDTLVSQGSDAHALLSHFFTVGEIENRLFKGFPDLPPQTINPRLAAEENWAILKNDFEKAREEIKSAYRNLLMEINEGPRTRERVQAVVSKFQPSLAAAHSLYRKTFSELAVLEGAFPQFASQAKMPPSIRFAAIQKAPHPSCGLCKKSSDLLMEAMEELNLREKWHAELDSVPIGGGYIGPFHQFVNFLGETKEAAHPIFLSLDLTADQFGLSESVAEVDSHKQRLEKVRDEDLVKQRGLYHFQSHLGAAWAVYQFEKNVEWVRRRVKAPKDNGGEAESYFRLPQYLWKEFKEVLLSKEKEFPATVDRIVKRNRGIAQTYYSNYIWKIHIEKEVIPLLASFLFHKKKEKRPRLQSGHWRHSTGFVKRVLKFHESLHVFFKNNQGYLTFFLTHWMGIPREREKILQQNFARNFNDAFRDLDDAGNNLFWEELLVSFFTDRTFFHQVLKVLPKNFEDPREDRVEIPGEIAGFITFFKNSVDQRFQNIPSRIHPNRLKFLLDPQQTKSELRQKAWENPLHHILSRALAQGAAIYDLTRLEKDVWTKTSFPMEVRIKLFFMRTLAEKGNFRTWVFDFDKLLDPMADIVKLAVQIRWLKDEFEGRARLKQFLEEGAFGSLAEVVKKPSGKGIPPSLETSWQNLDWYFRNIRLAAEKTGSKIAVYTGTKDKPQLEELRTRVHENQEKIFYSGGSWGGWDLIPLLNPSLDHPSLIYAVKHVQGVNFDSIRPVYDPIKFISSAVQSLLQDEGWTPEQRSIALPTEGMDPVLDAFNATAQSLLPMIRLQENFSNYDDLLITEKMDWGGEGGDEVDNLTTPAPTEFPNEPVGGRPSFTGGGSGHPGPAVLTIKEKRTIAPLADFYSLLEEAGLSFRWEGISVLSKDRDLALAVDEEQAPLVHELLSRYPKKKIFLFLADKQARFGEELHNQYPERVFFTPVHGSDLFQNRKDKNFLHMDSFLSAVSSHPDRRNMLVLLPDELIPLTGPQADQWESLFEDVSFSVLRDTLIDIFEGVLLSASALSDILNLQRARIVQSQA